MYYNRVALKRSAKRLVRQGTPAVFLVTLVYILATTWVSTIADLVVPNPLNGLAEVVNNWSLTISEMEYVTQGTLDAMTQQIWASLRGTQAMIGLLVALIVSFYSMVVNFGYYGYSLRIMRGQEGGFRDLFSNFYMAGKIILLQVLKVVFVYLWMLLFIFPGIIALYRYRMAEYCLLDDPDISPLEAIRRSKKLMCGRKFDMFATELSFFGWLLLQVLAQEIAYMLGDLTGIPAVATILSVAVGTVIGMFLVAYQNLTYTGFYLFVLGNQAPPVQENPGFDPNGQPRNPFDGGDGNSAGFDRNPWDVGGQNSDNEGWNQ